MNSSGSTRDKPEAAVVIGTVWLSWYVPAKCSLHSPGYEDEHPSCIVDVTVDRASHTCWNYFTSPQASNIAGACCVACVGVGAHADLAIHESRRRLLRTPHISDGSF